MGDHREEGVARATEVSQYQMTDDELTELFDERAGIREFDGLTATELDRMTSAQRDPHRRAAEQAAYWDLRKLLGDVKLPEAILEKARKFTTRATDG